MSVPTPNEQVLQELLALFSHAHYDDCESRTRELLAQCPEHGFLWKVLGVVLRQQGRNAEALLAMQKAAELLPDDAEAHANFAVTLMNNGQLAEAVNSYRRALAIEPDAVEVLHHLGLSLMSLGQFAEAEACYRRVLLLNVDYPDALFDLACILQEQGQLVEAEQCYRGVLEKQPQHSTAHSNLAYILHWQQRWAEAEVHYQYAIKLNGRDASAFSRLGLLLQTQGRLIEALDCYQCALEINPQFTEIHNNLGIVYHELGLEEEAKACYQKALTINPYHAESYNNLGLSLQAQGQWAKAEAAYRSALSINIDNAEVHNNLGILFQQVNNNINALACYQKALLIKPNNAQTHNNLGTLYRDLGLSSKAEASFRHALAIDPDYNEARSNLLFTMNYGVTHSPAECLAEAQLYDDRVQQKIGTVFSHWYAEEQPKRLRVGIVLADNHHHALTSVLADLDNSIELIAYPSTYTLAECIEPYVSEWKPLVGLNDAAAAQLIRNDGVHILLDVLGHSNHNRLPVFAYKPAPIQVSCLGFLATTGLKTMDYVLGDPYLTPVSDAADFSEKIWQLPDSYYCFDVPDNQLTVNALPVLSEQKLTFACFSPLEQLNDTLFSVWARILHAVPNSRLLLKNHQLSDTFIRHTIQQHFAELGILPERLLLESNATQADRLTAYQRVDIVLDSFPHNGTQHSIEALWMGVPVLSRVGDRMIARCGESILANMELTAWLANDDTDYVAKAIQFAGDIEQLSALRASLRQQLLDSPLLDSAGFARNFEAALWSMYQS
jgi:predicted O-linked N-acetylglucosamine transferase (SPINDLY family)